MPQIYIVCSSLNVVFSTIPLLFALDLKMLGRMANRDPGLVYVLTTGLLVASPFLLAFDKWEPIWGYLALPHLLHASWLGCIECITRLKATTNSSQPEVAGYEIKISWRR